MLNIYSSICSVPYSKVAEESCVEGPCMISGSQCPQVVRTFTFKNQRKNQYEEGAVQVRG